VLCSSAKLCIVGAEEPTHFSVVSFRSFSALSNSSSNNCTFLARFSPVVRWVSPSSAALFRSLTLPSDFSRSPSARESLCWREEISWSRSRRVWFSYSIRQSDPPHDETVVCVEAEKARLAHLLVLCLGGFCSCLGGLNLLPKNRESLRRKSTVSFPSMFDTMPASRREMAA